jgi:hypothetical protein
VFSRISRYRSLPDVVVEDARGRTLASKALRLLPDVSGTFRHTVEEGERLDHLAFKYYRQPRKWWRVCDANPEFLSPLDLVGRGSIVTVRFTCATPTSTQPPWSAVAAALGAEEGVESFLFVDDVRLTPEPQTIAGQQLTIHVERHEFAVVVAYNERVVAATELAALLGAAGFPPAQPVVLGQVGRLITVPPDAVG